MKVNTILAVTATWALATSAQAQTMCVFDLLGTQGDSYGLMKDYSVAAKQWGANITLKAYPDERIASEDFKAGQCDAVALSGLRARQFNSFVGSIDSIGGLPNNATAKMILSLMANPKLAADMQNKGYEVGGVTSLGSAYIMVRDRKINSLAKAAGIRFGILDYDKAQAIMVQKVGAQPVSSDLMSIGGKFNNGQVDAIGMPALAFRPMELFKGLGTKGAVFRFPVLHITYDIIIRSDKFPEGYGQKSRTWVASLINREFENILKTENGIDAKYWEDLTANEKLNYSKLMRVARIDLTKQDIYNKKMMGILKKVRCQQDPTSFECSITGE
ncbi:MAG: putative multidrug efflux protein AdeT1 [Aquirhabdus sp.]